MAYLVKLLSKAFSALLILLGSVLLLSRYAAIGFFFSCGVSAFIQFSRFIDSL